MLQEKVIILLSARNKEGDWDIVITDKYGYNLRLGGYERIAIDAIDFDLYDVVDIPFSGMSINKNFTDGEYSYLWIGEYVLVWGWVDISLDGQDMDFGFKIRKIVDYDQGFFELGEDFFHMELGDNGFSRIVK